MKNKIFEKNDQILCKIWEPSKPFTKNRNKPITEQLLVACDKKMVRVISEKWKSFTVSEIFPIRELFTQEQISRDWANERWSKFYCRLFDNHDI